MKTILNTLIIATAFAAGTAAAEPFTGYDDSWIRAAINSAPSQRLAVESKSAEPFTSYDDSWIRAEIKAASSSRPAGDSSHQRPVNAFWTQQVSAYTI